ncbi:hypothetical protein OGAPHI_004406 [Ogataea philodendri]|uniref:Uncharacterized protein n=1 Tax=Ogataea philodendri TaxID=1378263 RepID=A0A9P8P6J6_9ASCO|nr:uncharacterized protein OGAPHI_004406 [Ogataea philodendri]KAH3666217.1 hypothetical protein OGAPHI_004406 [Ogataea philodendri]
MLVDTSGQRNLLVYFRACWRGERQSGHVCLDGHHSCSRGGRANIHHQHVVNLELSHTGLFLAVGLDSQQSSQKEVVDLDVCENRRQVALRTNNLSNQTVGSTQSRVDVGSHTNQSSWNGKL